MKPKDAIAALFFLIVSTLIFLPMFISGKLFFWLDFLYYFMPFRELTAGIIKGGNVPLWNPYIFCGNPLLANMQSAVFYPLNVVYYVLPFAAAVKVQTLLAFFIASFSMYALARSYKTSRLAAMLAGSVFAFGFYLTVRAVEMADLHVIIWIPAIMLMARKYAASGRVPDLFLLALCLAMSFLGGHPQVFSYAFILFTALYFFESSGVGIKAAECVKKYLLVNIIFAVFIIVQLAPTLEFMLLSKRAAEGVGQNVHLSTFAGTAQAVAFVLPFLHGVMDRSAGFLNWMALIDTGIPAVILLFSGIFIIRKGSLKIFLFSLLGIAAAISFAGNFGFYRLLLNKLPALGAIEYLSKINVICLAAMCLLCALSFDAFFRGGVGYRKAGMTLFVISCVVALAAIAANLWKETAAGLCLNMMNSRVVLTAADKTKLLSGISLYAFFFFIFSAMALASASAENKYLRYAAFLTAFAAIFSYHAAGYDSYAGTWSFSQKTDNTAFLGSQPDILKTRVLAPVSFNRFDYSVAADNREADVYYIRDSMFPNTPVLDRFYNADGFDSLETASFNSLTKRIRGMSAPWNSPAFPLLSAGYIISQAQLTNKKLKLVSKGFSKVYRFKNPMPLSYFIPAGKKIVFSDNDEGVLSMMTSAGFKAADELFLEKTAEAVFIGVDTGNGKCTVDRFVPDPNTFILSADAPCAGAIVVNDNFYPGWKALLNGKKTRIFRANHTFMAVAVGKGKNEIRMTFDPDMAKAAAWLSIFWLFAAMGYGGFCVRCPQKVS